MESLQNHQEIQNLPEVEEETCEISKEIFDGVKSLREHITNNHGDPRIICELCGKEYRPELLKQHIEYGHGNSALTFDFV